MEFKLFGVYLGESLAARREIVKNGSNIEVWRGEIIIADSFSAGGAPHGIAPRVYCAANPLRFTDPSGMIVTDGEHVVIYLSESNTFDVDEGFNPEILGILKKLAETDTGKQLIEEAQNLDYDINISIGENHKDSTDKVFYLGSTDLFQTTETHRLTRAEVGIYRGGIRRQLNYLIQYKNNPEEIEEKRYQEWGKYQPSFEELAAGVLAHEFGHITREGKGTEAYAERNELSVLNDYKNFNYKFEQLKNLFINIYELIFKTNR